MPLRTTARMTAFSPGQSPPPVRIPIFIPTLRIILLKVGELLDVRRRDDSVRAAEAQRLSRISNCVEGSDTACDPRGVVAASAGEIVGRVRLQAAQRRAMRLAGAGLG